MRTNAGALLLVASVVATGGCNDTDITGVGNELVAGGVVRTIELVLDASAFLVSDSTVGGFTDESGAATQLIALDAANGFEGRAALQFASAPFSINVPIDSTTAEEDTLATFVGARLEIVLDSVSPAPDDSVTLLAEALSEAWDPVTATWSNRVDSALVMTPWSVPGGGAVTFVDSVAASPGDTVEFSVDSATANRWTDAEDPTRGVLLRTISEGGRVEIASVILWLQARPSIRDTIIEVPIGTTGRTTLLDAPPRPPGTLAIGGVPARRMFFRFAQGIDTLPVTCPDEDPECGLTVADADLTFASLRLTPVPLPGSPAIYRGAAIAARAVTPDPQFPLSRAPLVGPSNGTTNIAVDSSGVGVADSLIEVDVTGYLNDFLTGEESVGDRVGVAALAEGFRFGTIGFARAGQPNGPRLRLVLTLATPQEIR